ncbi:MAG: class I SAM-dependent methyltransferase [Bacteroidota bacterium]
MKHRNHYKESYFKWQGKIGEFGGWANLDKFIDYIEEDFSIVDFGSGGGYLLNNIHCKEKIGIEINPTAIEKAEELGIKTVSSTDFIPDEYADLIISNNSLEHTTHPLEELRKLYKKLKVGGKMVFVVPCESISYDYRPNDINYHLYSWSPMCLGNLFTEAGFNVLESKAYKHKWPPNYEKIAKVFNRKIFNLTCKIYARMETSWYQVRVVAQK